MSWIVYRQQGKAWVAISRAFALESQAIRFMGSLPGDWVLEVRTA